MKVSPEQAKIEPVPEGVTLLCTRPINEVELGKWKFGKHARWRAPARPID
jgi:hypothetical protein